MKEATITFTFALLISLFATSQTYHPLPESNTYWQYEYLDTPDGCGCFGVCYKEQIGISGDTVINQTIYHKIELHHVGIGEDCTESPPVFIGYQGAFRNDVESKIAWHIPEGAQNEVLLYDFNLTIGDTVPIGIINPNGYNMMVEDIDSVEVGNLFHKRLHLYGELNWGEMPLQIIEGIGGQHLINPMETWVNFESGYWFNCVNIGDTISYPYSCEMIVGNNPFKKTQSFEIYPNPSQGKFWIQNPKGKNEFLSIEVFNSFGKRLMEFETAEELMQIDLSDKPKGVYLIRIKSSKEVFNEKVIVQ
ncbi:MAG: T9SS type A sorting domain-containing protein [Chlorobi bacterium]|nr:T9SS type A sorting domain-containing protein [Chlorobiota bacterium]